MYGLLHLTGNASGWASGYTVFNMNNADFGPATLALMSQSGLVNPNSQLMSIMTNSSSPIYVSGPYTLIFNLKVSISILPSGLGSVPGLIFDTQYVLNNGGFGTPAAYNPNFNAAPIPGTGPYTVTNVVMNSEVTIYSESELLGEKLDCCTACYKPVHGSRPRSERGYQR